MALLFMDGLDGYSTITDAYTFTYSGSGMTYATNTGRFGGGAMFMGSSGVAIIPVICGLEIYLGFAIKMSDTRNSDCLICGVTTAGLSDSGYESVITFNPATGSLKYWFGRLNTQIGSFAIPSLINDNNWHWVDFHFKIHPTAGVIEMWLDGNSLGNLSGVDTQRNTSETALNGVVIGSLFSFTPQSFIDDIVIVDVTGSINNARIGDSKIELLQPTSDDGPNNGTPSTGSTHFGVVDEPGWDNSDYLTITNTSGQEELFGFANLGSTPATISAVQFTNISQKTDTGAASLENIIVSSGTEHDSASTSLGTTWSRAVTIQELDPHTSAAWTAAAVNAIQAGVKVP